VAGIVLFTPGIHARPPAQQPAVLRLGREFKDVKEENDPYGAPDCGRFDAAGEQIMVKLADSDKKDE
jgi:hypothetical protein